MKSLRTSLSSLFVVLSLVPACSKDVVDTDTDAGIGGGSSGNGTDTGGSSGNAGTGTDTGGSAPDDDAGVATDSLAISGTYDSDYGTVVTITDDAYSEDGEFGYENEVTTFDNDEQYLVTFDAAATAGTQYSKVLWVQKDGKVYVCTALFFLPSVEEASAEDDADREDLDMGCGGFPWTVLTPSSGDPDAG
jgi:hypothetical protein